MSSEFERKLSGLENYQAEQESKHEESVELQTIQGNQEVEQYQEDSEFLVSLLKQHIQPILETANRISLKNRGLIICDEPRSLEWIRESRHYHYGLKFPPQEPVIRLQWDETENGYHQIAISINIKKCLKIRFGNGYYGNSVHNEIVHPSFGILGHFDKNLTLEKSTWTKAIENTIIEALRIGNTFVVTSE